MTNYVVRLRNYNGFIVDGEIYTANNESEAKMYYLARCKKLGIAIGKYDYITVENIEL
jgi:hypothetical protein